ncbi:hypothetical protein [Rhizobium phaseoli]|uniref:Uncharacterized protein n=1 Tax=Rhizobium phaseoli TaxID=396 RepID=A0ABM6C8Y2_9HYPH|nr:hypothetical protein [Rhizobium phaseoli]ANL84672.1 hypothetical protein AMC81_CH01891 [Rhizobium phaseoli]ANL91179.1 hypothetical protein AMC80_CH01891 [Rhizobium phaseoli]
MSTTVAAIAAEAFTAVAAEVSGVVQSCTLTKVTQGAYNAATGQYSETTTTATGRAVIATGGSVEGGIASTIKDMFPAYVAGPADVVMFLIELSAAPKENDKITVGGVARTIKAAGDIVGAGALYVVIAT